MGLVEGGGLLSNWINNALGFRVVAERAVSERSHAGAIFP